MKKIYITRYIGTAHTTLVAEKKHNPETLKEDSQLTYKTGLHNDHEAIELWKDLVQKVNADSEDEFDIEVRKDWTVKDFSKIDTARLKKMYEKTEKMLGAKELIAEILIKRGALEPAPQKKSSKTVEGTPEKKERTYKKSMSNEDLQARLASVRENIVKSHPKVKFYCTKEEKEYTGIIRTARLDKRSGLIQFRIEILAEDGSTRTGRILGKADDSKTIQFES